MECSVTGIAPLRYDETFTIWEGGNPPIASERNAFRLDAAGLLFRGLCSANLDRSADLEI